MGGNLSSLQESTSLRFLNLRKTKIFGDISSLQALSQLLEVYLEDTKASGDLSGFQDLRQMRKLYLSYTFIQGDLSSLRKLEWLQDLTLTQTMVKGQLSATKLWAKNILFLHLDQTFISGDLSSLRGFGDLEQLHLSYTNLTGSLLSLKASQNSLRELYLAGTQVTGDLGDPLIFRKLEEVDLSGTQIFGRFGSAWRGKLPQLRVLKLNNCKQLPFLPLGEDLLDLRSHFYSDQSQVILPKLIILELSGSPLNGDLSDLLIPVSSCASLASIRANHCGLTGSLSKIWLKNVQLDAHDWAEWLPPLALSLQTLDLADNSLSFVETIPENLQSLLLAGNLQPLGFRSGFLRDAIMANTFIDLQKVRLTNSKDHG